LIKKGWNNFVVVEKEDITHFSSIIANDITIGVHAGLTRKDSI
jgi:hypothetical protein